MLTKFEVDYIVTASNEGKYTELAGDTDAAQWHQMKQWRVIVKLSYFCYVAL